MIESVWLALMCKAVVPTVCFCGIMDSIKHVLGAQGGPFVISGAGDTSWHGTLYQVK